jgi:hypothetical protein
MFERLTVMIRLAWCGIPRPRIGIEWLNIPKSMIELCEAETASSDGCVVNGPLGATAPTGDHPARRFARGTKEGAERK